MKVKNFQGEIQREILIGMICNKKVLGAIASKWKEPGLFQSRWANLLGSWCVKFINKYNQPPRASIEIEFEKWATKTDDEATINPVSTLLQSLNDEYTSIEDEINAPYLIDKASEHFSHVHLQQHIEDVQNSIDSNNLIDAQFTAEKYGAFQLQKSSGGPITFDDFASAMEIEQDTLISYPGAIGEFFGTHLQRDGFIAFLAPEKRGKSWWLLDMAWRATLQRRRVALFEVGDMSKKQVNRRLMTRVSKIPWTPSIIKIPIAIQQEDGKAEISTKTSKFTTGVNQITAWKAYQKAMHGRRGDYLKLFNYPNSTISVQGIKSVLEIEEHRGWIPDVIIIDYADILSPPSGVADTRDQINATWKQLRGLSQERHCLIVTATQADADSYERDILRRRNFSDDKRKYAHVTGMVGLNQTIGEKMQGIFRLNWIVLREGEFSESRCVYSAGNLKLGNPCMKSCW